MDDGWYSLSFTVNRDIIFELGRKYLGIPIERHPSNLEKHQTTLSE
jgi:hypothetical protein